MKGRNHENEPGEMGGVVVPLLNADGEPDTWFTDVDEDGTNDLIFPCDAEHNLLAPFINEAGQVLAAQYVAGKSVSGYLLTPDRDDPNGANPLSPALRTAL